MSTDWRSLAAELAAELERCRPLAEVPDCLARARAALAAEPVGDGPAVQSREPASVVGEPSDEELLDIAAQAIDGYSSGIKLGEYEAENEIAVEAYGSELIAFARAVLARYGHQPAPPDEAEQRHPAPVPVAERLPRPGDCNEMGQCWWFDGDVWSLDIYDHEYTYWLSASALLLPTTAYNTESND